MQQEYLQIYQSQQRSLYYVKGQRPIMDNIYVLDTNNFSFGGSQIHYEDLYKKQNYIIETTILTRNIQINKTDDGFSEALICAFAIFKEFTLDNALEFMKLAGIELPSKHYLPSLRNYEASFQRDEIRSMRSSIISIECLEQAQQVQSEILNFPVFSQRLIESQRFSQILDTEHQIESEIISSNNPSIITFGQNESISEEPQINYLQSSMTLTRSKK